MRYRITSYRFDCDERVYQEFEAHDDAFALIEFERIAANPSNDWDNMQIFRIEQVEVLKEIASNKNHKRFLKSGD